MRMEVNVEPDNIFPIQYRVRVVCLACNTGELDLKPVNSEIRCTECGASFPVNNKLIDLLPESSQPPLAAPMEWGWMVRLYETRWWRTGPINNISFGISFEEEFETIVQAMNLIGDEVMLDLACGPGIYARPLAKKLNRGIVVGLDLSLPMLHYTNMKAQAEGTENLLLIHGSAKDLPFPDNQFDVVNCCGALHLFPELSTIKGIRRVLKPGGRFTVGTTRRLLQGPVGKRIYDYMYRKGGVKYFYRDELESLFSQAGFANVVCHHEKRYWHIMSAGNPE